MDKRTLKLHCTNCSCDWDEEEKAGIYIVCPRCGRGAPVFRNLRRI